MKRKKRIKSIQSIRRGERLTILILILFFLGMGVLVLKIVLEAPFYMSHSNNITLGKVYDCHQKVLFDPDATAEEYGSDYFLDIGNVIGDDSGQMTNTLVSENLESLQNYSLIFGATESGGEAAIYATLDHAVNQTVYQSFGSKNGTAIAYNYKTGEILVCVSKPSVNILDGYTNIDSLEEGSLICKAFYETTPGSTQKVATTAAALEELGYDGLMAKSYYCSGSYTTVHGEKIICHNAYGHGTQNIVQAFENSCNPFFAQLVEDLPLDSIIRAYEQMGISVNGGKSERIEIDGIHAFKASVELTDTSEFNTMWNCMGQSEALASPCQMMLWESAIANGTGVVTNAYLIDHVENVMGQTTYNAETSYGDQVFPAEVASELKEIMLKNGADQYGSIPYSVGVKSGTAQVDNGASENSLLVGFCNDPDLPIAFCVVIEDRVSGEVSTTDIVSKMLQALDSSN